VSALLVLLLSWTLSPEAARAKQGPMLFGSGQVVFLLGAPAGPGDTLRLARVRVSDANLPADTNLDDAEYHFSPAGEPSVALRPGQLLTGPLWRFGAESPEGRKRIDALHVEVVREDRLAPATGRGLGYRAFGTPDRLYFVHAGMRFVQIIRVFPAGEASIPPEGVPVRLDRPSQEPATRLLPGEYARVTFGDGKTTRVTAGSEIWFVTR